MKEIKRVSEPEEEPLYQIDQEYTKKDKNADNHMAEVQKNPSQWEAKVAERIRASEEIISRLNPSEAQNFYVTKDYGKITCKLTGHQLNNEKDLLTYISSNSKYQLAIQNCSFDFNFCKFIVPHKSNKNKMFCLITRCEMNKTKEDVLKHYNGKSYIKVMYNAWKRRMLRTKKYLIFKLNLIKRNDQNLKIKARHRGKINRELFPDSLKKKKFLRLKAISRRSLLLIRKNRKNYSN